MLDFKDPANGYPGDSAWVSPIKNWIRLSKYSHEALPLKTSKCITEIQSANKGNPMMISMLAWHSACVTRDKSIYRHTYCTYLEATQRFGLEYNKDCILTIFSVEFWKLVVKFYIKSIPLTVVLRGLSYNKYLSCSILEHKLSCSARSVIWTIKPLFTAFTEVVSILQSQKEKGTV